MKKAFTMIELIFVIVIISILASIALPKLNSSRIDAEISKNVSLIKATLSDISAYAASQGEVLDDMTKMSFAITSLVISNDIANRTIEVKIGEVSNCVTLSITQNAALNNITVLNVSYSGDDSDEICSGAKKLLSKAYSIPLMGRYVKR